MSPKNSIDAINPESKKLFIMADNLAFARANYLKSQKTVHNIEKNKFISAVSKKLFNRTWRPEKATLASLKHKESKLIGSKLFGVRPTNERIEFFNDNHKSWFFYQEKTSVKGVVHSQTFHYEVNDDCVLRVVNSQSMRCEKATGKDLDNFIKASEVYYGRVMREIYGIEPTLDKINQ